MINEYLTIIYFSYSPFRILLQLRRSILKFSTPCRTHHIIRINRRPDLAKLLHVSTIHDTYASVACQIGRNSNFAACNTFCPSRAAGGAEWIVLEILRNANVIASSSEALDHWAMRAEGNTTCERLGRYAESLPCENMPLSNLKGSRIEVRTTCSS